MLRRAFSDPARSVRAAGRSARLLLFAGASPGPDPAFADTPFASAGRTARDAATGPNSGWRVAAHRDRGPPSCRAFPPRRRSRCQTADAVLSLPQHGALSRQRAAGPSFATGPRTAAPPSSEPLESVRPSAPRARPFGKPGGGRPRSLPHRVSCRLLPAIRRSEAKERKCRSQENPYPGSIERQPCPDGPCRRARPRSRGTAFREAQRKHVSMPARPVPPSTWVAVPSVRARVRARDPRA